MSISATQRRAPPARNLLETLQNDPIAGLTLGVFAAVTLLYVLPILPAEYLRFVSLRLGPFFFLSLLVVALRWQLARIKAKEDREFWNDLLRAFSCWWAAAALILFFPGPGEKPFAVDFATSLLYALYYVGVLMAVERQPHRRHRWRPFELERWLSWPTVTAVVFGLFLYFPFIAVWTNTEAYSTGVPDLCFFLALDAYLGLRLLYLWRVTASPRWRLTYVLLAAAMSTLLLNDVAEFLALTTRQKLWRWDALANVALYLPYIFVVAAARLRHHPFPWEPPPPASRIRLEDNLPGPLGQTMTFLLLFPLIHFFAYELEILDAPSRGRREILVLVWLPVLGVIAMVQYRILERALSGLKFERLSSERALHKTQKELRLAQERQHTDEALRESDERFDKAFRACPDVMAISRLEDGLLLEVNESCRRVFGYEPKEFLGHTSDDLGLWSNPEERARAVEVLGRHGQITLESEFRKKSGEERIALFSARKIDIDGRPHIFSVTRDITRARDREEALVRKLAGLDGAESAVWAVDDEGLVVYWNGAAERCYGWSAEDLVGRPESCLWPGEESDGGEDRMGGKDCIGVVRRRLLRKDGGTAVVDCLAISAAGKGGERRARLVVSRPEAKLGDDGA